MHDKKNVVLVIIAAVCAVVVVVIVLYRNGLINFGGESGDGNGSYGRVVGTYADGQMSLVLKSDRTFRLQRGNYAAVTGTYTYKVSNDGSEATVTFQVSGEYYGYDGAIIHFSDKNTYLIPTTNGYPDISVSLRKI